jgi:hypothetical protein
MSKPDSQQSVMVNVTRRPRRVPTINRDDHGKPMPVENPLKITVKQLNWHLDAGQFLEEDMTYTEDDYNSLYCDYVIPSGMQNTENHGMIR